jgi:predicted nucleic acid-binding protein
MRFWDSSAIVPLIVAQASSPRVEAWMGCDTKIAMWTLTPVEVTSALQRLFREGALGEDVIDEAERRVVELVRACHIVVDVENVKAQARRLLRLHPLRAADALQLAAAVEWSGGRPAGRMLHTLDGRLASAARREGFVVPD